MFCLGFENLNELRHATEHFNDDIDLSAWNKYEYRMAYCLKAFFNHSQSLQNWVCIVTCRSDPYRRCTPFRI
jgi:hypothetical protein